MPSRVCIKLLTGLARSKGKSAVPGCQKTQHDHPNERRLSGSPRIPRFDLRLVVQNHVQQGIMDLKFSVVFDKAQFAEFVHKKAHARPGRADHLRQSFLTELSHDRLRLTFLAKICKQKEKASQ